MDRLGRIPRSCAASRDEGCPRPKVKFALTNVQSVTQPLLDYLESEHVSQHPSHEQDHEHEEEQDEVGEQHALDLLHGAEAAEEAEKINIYFLSLQLLG